MNSDFFQVLYFKSIQPGLDKPLTFATNQGCRAEIKRLIGEHDKVIFYVTKPGQPDANQLTFQPASDAIMVFETIQSPRQITQGAEIAIKDLNATEVEEIAFKFLENLGMKRI